MPGLRIELSPPEAVERFRDVAHTLLEWENGELSAELKQHLAEKAQELGVHPLDRDAVVEEVAALPAIQSLRRLPEEDIKQLAEQARQGDATALARLRQQAEGGHATAQHNLGLMYVYGEGVPEDDDEAAKWYRLAAEQGHATAQNKLGWIYQEGRGVRPDDCKAVKWYRLAAEQGYATAQNNLGEMYEYGYGVPQDEREAVKWYRRAAEQNHATAQYKLGEMYFKGCGVSQNDREATNWYRLAAEHGNTDAKEALDRIQKNAKKRGQPSRQKTKPITEPALSKLSGEAIGQLFKQAREGDATALDKIRQAQAALGRIQKKHGQLFRQETKPLTKPVAGQAETLSADCYLDDGDGTVTDVQTGLQWMRFSLGQEWKDGACVGEARSYKWQAALDAAEALNRQGGYAGYRDWRVPTKKELQTLIYCSSGQPKTWNDTGKWCKGDYERPTIYQPDFPNTPDNGYWSSSTYADDPSYAWNVDFNNGFVYAGHKSFANHARLVRGGQ